MNKSTKYLIGVIAALFVIVLIGLIIKSASSRHSGIELVLDNVLNISFKGKVDSVYNDLTNHNTKTLVLSDGHKYGLYPEWETKVAIGDSLYKSKGTLQVEVYKNDGRKMILDYRQLTQHWKKAWFQ